MLRVDENDLVCVNYQALLFAERRLQINNQHQYNV